MSAQMTPNELQNLFLKKQNQGRHFEFAYVHRHTEKKKSCPRGKFTQSLKLLGVIL